MTTTAIFASVFCLAIIAAPSMSMEVSRDCSAKREECGDLVDFFKGKRGQTFDLSLGSICSETNDVVECYGECASVIRNRPVEGLGLKIRDYLCDSSRREEVVAALSSSCLRDGSLDRSTDEAMDKCMGAALSKPEYAAVIAEIYVGDRSNAATLCPAVDALTRCLTADIADICGQDVMPVAGDVLNMVIREFLSSFVPPCFSRR